MELLTLIRVRALRCHATGSVAIGASRLPEREVACRPKLECQCRGLGRSASAGGPALGAEQSAG